MRTFCGNRGYHVMKAGEKRRYRRRRIANSLRKGFVAILLGALLSAQCVPVDSVSEDGADLLRAQFLLTGFSGVCARLSMNGVDNYRAELVSTPGSLCSNLGRFGSENYAEALAHVKVKAQRALKIIEQQGQQAVCPVTIARLQGYLGDPTLSFSDGIFVDETTWNSLSLRYEIYDDNYKARMSSRLTAAGLSSEDISTLMPGNYSQFLEVDALQAVVNVASSQGEGTCYSSGTEDSFLTLIDPGFVAFNSSGTASGPKRLYSISCNYGPAAASELCDSEFTIF